VEACIFKYQVEQGKSEIIMINVTNQRYANFNIKSSNKSQKLLASSKKNKQKMSPFRNKKGKNELRKRTIKLSKQRPRKMKIKN
jgi:hypothetical protein